MDSGKSQKALIERAFWFSSAVETADVTAFLHRYFLKPIEANGRASRNELCQYSQLCTPSCFIDLLYWFHLLFNKISLKCKSRDDVHGSYI